MKLRHPGKDIDVSDFVPGVHIPATVEKIHELLEQHLIKEYVHG